MQIGAQTNALAEIALALSMAFFSIMVLTLVSMGAGEARNTFISKISETSVAVQKSRMNSQEKKKQTNSKLIKTRMVSPEKFVIYFEGKYYDAKLNPLSPTIPHITSVKYLAVEPDLPMQKAIAVQERFKGHKFTITTLSEDWLQKLQEKSK